MPTINLYTMEGCPKCNILRQRCNNSPFIKNSDFQESVVDMNNKEDTNLQLLIEHHISSMPVLLVDNTFYSFNEAMQLIEQEDAKIE